MGGKIKKIGKSKKEKLDKLEKKVKKSFFSSFKMPSNINPFNVNSNQYDKCNHKDVTQHEAIELELTATLLRPSIQAQPVLSADGRRAFYVYLQGVTPPDPPTPAIPPPQSTIAAEVFNIGTSGDLVTLSTITLAQLSAAAGTTITQINGGTATEDFSRFIILADNLTFGQNNAVSGIGYLFLLDQNLQVFKALKITDYPVTTGSLLSAEFSPNNNYIVFTYVITQPTTTVTSAVTKLRVVNAQTLVDVISTTLQGYTNGARFFELCECKTKSGECQKGQYRDLYIGVPTIGLNISIEGGVTSTASTALSFVGPSQLYIFQFSNNKLTPIDAASLPSFTSDFQVFQPAYGCVPYTLILTGARPVDIERSIFTTLFTGFLGNDNRNQRLYLFDGVRLQLVYARAIPQSTVPIAFDPRGQFIVNGNLEGRVPNCPGSFTLAKIKGIKDAVLEGCAVKLRIDPFGIIRPIPPLGVIADINKSGDWLAFGGSATGTTTDGTPDDPLNNVVLYRIIRNKC